MLSAGLLLDGFVRRDRGGDQQHPVEREFAMGFLRADQMGQMRRVERPAEDSKPQWTT
jgi:hypothetical protein